MQGLITLDFGNTNPSAALFQKSQGGWDLLKVTPFQELSLYLSQLNMTPHNTSVALCEVKSREEELFPLIQQGFLLTRVKKYWRGNKFAGMQVHYAQSLGEDRLLTAFYSFKKDRIPTLIIDAGTFCTMDVVNAEGFQGGYIVPGTEAYFSVFQKGEQLKDLDLDPEFSSGLPHETRLAMSSSYRAFHTLALDLIREHKIQKIILTGGQMELWKKIFTIPVEADPHYLHRSIHYWMTTQIEPL